MGTIAIWLAMASPSLAQDSVWVGGTGSWGSAFNWQSGLVPSSGRNTRIDNGGTARIAALSGDGFTDNLTLGSPTGASGALEVSGSSLTVADDIVAGLVGGAGSLTIFAGGFVINNDSFIGGAATVTGASSEWRCYTMSITGTLTVADSGDVALGGGAGTGAIQILSGGRVNIGQGGASGKLRVQHIINDGVLNFDHTDDELITDQMLGGGSINKSGAASTTTLRRVFDFTGSFSVETGVLALQGSVNGNDYLASNGGTLRFDGSAVDLNLASVRAGAGGVVEYDGASVRDGFLRGPGEHSILDSTSPTTFTAITTFNSTSIVQNGAASFVNFVNGGALTNNVPLTFDGGVIASTGSVQVHSTLTTLDVGNSGVVTVNSGGVIDNQVGNFVCGGGSRTLVNSGGVINLASGTTVELNGALLVNDGTINGDTNVNFGSLATGTGEFGLVNITQGGEFSPGNSPGQATLAAANFGAGGRYRFELSDAAGSAGAGYDSLLIDGDLNISAGATTNSRFTIEVASLDGLNQPGQAEGFDPAQSYAFTLATTGAGITGFAPEKFAIDVSDFENDLAGGRFSLVESDSKLVLRFSPQLSADFDNDGDVDGDDLDQWQGDFGLNGESDADRDGDSDGSDFLAWQRQLVGPPSHLPVGVAVPEPAALALALVAAALGISSNRSAVRSSPAT
jgi:T5SS/PEP-CTERM-associated repeat protein